MQGKLCLLSIMKNETMNLKVWLEHYIWQGVEHFYIIDNDSVDNPLEILQPYIDSGFVTYIFLAAKHAQTQHYNTVYNNYAIKDKFKWMIVCDHDEFIFGTEKKLADIVDDYISYDVVYVNWLMFGSCGFIDHPEDIRISLTKREPILHPQTKYIANLTRLNNQHHMELHYLHNGKNIIHVNDRIHLNHYPIQSVEFFTKVKMTRGDAYNPASDGVRDMNYFNSYNINVNTDDFLLKTLIENGYPNQTQ